jgi:hypothetical protein
MALYNLSGRSKDRFDELTGFINGKEPFGYHPKTGCYADLLNHFLAGKAGILMSQPPKSYLQIPEAWGWDYPEPAAAQSLHAELQRELPPGHPLFGRSVEAVAFRQDKYDVLFRHLDHAG